MTSQPRGRCLSSRAMDGNLENAAEILGWSGALLTGVSLLGTRASFVVSVDATAHQWRLDNHCACAMLDPDDLAIWEWPEGSIVFPPTVVSITGVLTHEGHPTRQRLSTARKWRGFGATAVMMAANEEPAQDLLLECSYSGIAVVQQGSGEDADLLLPGRDGRLVTARRTTVDRWVEEQLYGRLLADGELPDALLM